MKDVYEIKEARTALLLKAPFFATLMYNMMKMQITDEVDTLGTDGTILFVNEEYFKKLPLPERVFALAHEICHAMFHHMERGKKYEELGFDGNKFYPALYNIATDFVINALLTESKIGTRRESWLLDRRFTADMNADDVYRTLYAELPPPPPCGSGGQGGDDGDGKGDGQNQGQGGGLPQTQDTHIYSNKAASQMEWKSAIEGAAAAAKSVGKLPGSLARIVGDIVEPEVDWKEQLKQAMVNTFGYEERTWSRPSRRHMAMYNEYLPGRTGYGCGSIVAVIDTSGSIGQKELEAFVSEIHGILTDTRPEALWVLGIDACVHDSQLIEDMNDLMEFSASMKGGGGTNMPVAFNWCAENDIEPHTMVFLTDGYTPFADDPGYPTVWAMTTSTEAPYGVSVHMKI